MAEQSSPRMHQESSPLGILAQQRSPALHLQAWLWAASTLSSRTMYVPFDEAGALTPFGDLHNYAPPPPPYTPSLTAAPRHARDSRGGGPGDAALGSACRQLQRLRAGEAGDGAGGPVRLQQQPGPGAPAGVRLSLPRLAFRREQEGELGASSSGASSGGASSAAGSAALDSRGPGRPPGGQATAAPGAQPPIPGPTEAGREAGGGSGAGPPASAAAEAESEAGALQQGARQKGQQEDQEQEQEQLCGDGYLDEAAGEYRIFARKRYALRRVVLRCAVLWCTVPLSMPTWLPHPPAPEAPGAACKLEDTGLWASKR